MTPVSKLKRLPEAVSFDEFKGNTGCERFQCIVADPLNRRVFDILPARNVETIQDYLLSFSNRNEVKYVVMDMNRGFRDVAKTFLPNAQIIIDRFHVVRYCTEAMENVRRDFQKTLPKAQQRTYSEKQIERYTVIAPSMSRKGNPYDDAMAENFFLHSENGVYLPTQAKNVPRSEQSD